MPDKRFLIIEDEPDLANLVALHLHELSGECVICHDGESGLREALSGKYQVVLLDLRLPGKDGLDVCRELRAQGVQTPVLMLTSRATELDRVLGLELGADDYLTKPFSNLELVARVKALLRRAQMGQTPVAPKELLQVGDVQVNGRDRTVAVCGRAIECTAKEFDLLQHFARFPGKVFRRMDLLQDVWGYGHEGYEHTVNSHINRLRAKIEPDPASPKYILTVWGVGYKFDAGIEA
ncbi:response regulator transcription factor [Simiduia agarivorans]|uniref:Phosphate regulon transcriptional regulatory protein PhoB n=1 Tax=Simiduia agarivorans (strain DSM 21679 / JCM 13881 / BCRC 17597 / SA1) TaxID=1117647 RepID=K4KHI2_SIMAS|nr:response regulator transcription factor [Simiduia agarivorans]AFU98476.1 winged helix family two component transcriptional regulator [Simiduia agarivorans SA1 = DSM 21679]